MHKLTITAPHSLDRAVCYDLDSRYFGLYWEPAGDELTITDGRTTYTAYCAGCGDSAHRHSDKRCVVCGAADGAQPPAEAGRAMTIRELLTQARNALAHADQMLGDICNNQGLR